jgi:hypothetical protein
MQNGKNKGNKYIVHPGLNNGVSHDGGKKNHNFRQWTGRVKYGF